MVYFVVGEEWRLQQVELDNNVTWHTDDIYFTSVQIKDFDTKSVVIKELIKFLLLFKSTHLLWIWHCLCFCHWPRNDWLCIVIAGCCVSLLIDGLTDWISLHLECQMRNSSRRRGLFLFTLCAAVCCSQKLCWTRFAGWFSWLFPAWLQWNDLFRCCDQLR